MRFYPTEECRYVSAIYCYNTVQKCTTAFSFLERKNIPEEDGTVHFLKDVHMFSRFSKEGKCGYLTKLKTVRHKQIYEQDPFTVHKPLACSPFNVKGQA